MQTSTYAITALRYAGPNIVGAMMGLFDRGLGRWDMNPAPARLNDVVDKLVEGDTVIALFADGKGDALGAPEIKVDILDEVTETLALDDEFSGRGLDDLPRF
jgi:hypothetical protein